MYAHKVIGQIIATRKVTSMYAHEVIGQIIAASKVTSMYAHEVIGQVPFVCLPLPAHYSWLSHSMSYCSDG